jgi:hypothetical protein
VTPLPLTEHVEVRLPVARSVNPVTGGNWEKVGVQPSIMSPASDALDVAYHAALKAIVTDSGMTDTSRAEARRRLDIPQS